MPWKRPGGVQVPPGSSPQVQKSDAEHSQDVSASRETCKRHVREGSSAGVSCYSWRDDKEDIRVLRTSAQGPKASRRAQDCAPTRSRQAPARLMRCDARYLGGKKWHVDTSLTWGCQGLTLVRPVWRDGCCSAEMDKEGRVYVLLLRGDAGACACACAGTGSGYAMRLVASRRRL